jgi:hypothetical protein
VVLLSPHLKITAEIHIAIFFTPIYAGCLAESGSQNKYESIFKGGFKRS